MPAHAIAICTTSGGAAGSASAAPCRGQRADQQRAFAADDHQAELRRQRGAQRGQDQRRGAGQRVLPGEPGAERALIHVAVEIERILAEQRDEDAEQQPATPTSAARGMTTSSAAPPDFAGTPVGAADCLPPAAAASDGAPTSAFTKSRRSRLRPDNPSSRARDPSGRATTPGGDHGLALVVLRAAP